jgi:hypothetical protein
MIDPIVAEIRATRERIADASLAKPVSLDPESVPSGKDTSAPAAS